MYARKRGWGWEIMAPAKLNLYLEVLGRRPDGFHDLETLMVPISLYDRLEWAPLPSDGTSLSLAVVGDHAGIPAGESNIVWRAAQVLAAEAGLEPHGRLTLAKRIPAAAGLGGGSSDAAAALVLLNSAWQINYPLARLAPLAALLGSDVPFFLAGSAAICRGRGEIIEPIACVPRLDFVVAKPARGVSTAEAFGRLASSKSAGPDADDSPARLTQLVDRLAAGRLSDAGQLIFNRFEAVAAEICAPIVRLREAFARLLCWGHCLTGSGSAYFGLAPSAWSARRAANLMSGWNLGAAFAVSTCAPTRCKEN